MELTPTSPVYGISVAAQLTGVDPQMLRAYESRGLIDPHRTDGGTRRYSNHDVQVVARITELLAAGLNLTGIAAVFLLEAENRRLRTEIDALKKQLPAAAPGATATDNATRRNRLASPPT